MIVVIGCGNPARGDDGAGIAVVRHLRETPLAAREDVRLVDAGTSGMEVMFQARGAARVIVVDASSSGSEPGAVFRLPAGEAETSVEPGYSQHGLRWDHALYAGRRMFGAGFTQSAEAYLIEAQTLDYGLELSAPVRAGVERVVREITAALETEAWVRNGRLYLTAAAHVSRLGGCAAVALLAHEGEWMLMPLRSGAGGLQVKQRNARGDRVVEAQEFFRSQGLEDDPVSRPLRLFDDPQRGGVRVELETG